MPGLADFVTQTNAMPARGGVWVDPRDEVLRKKKPKTIASPPQPQGGGGILGFLQSAGQSIGSDFARIGKGTANVVHEITGGAQRERDQQSKSQQGDIDFIKSMGVKIKNSKSDEERQRYRTAISNVSKTSNERDKGFIDTQSRVSEENDPLKGAASVAGIGLDVLGGGTGGSILKGGLKQAITRGAGQGALFGGAQGALEPIKDKGSGATAEDIGGKALTGAGVGALTGGIIGGAGKAVSKVANKSGGKPSSILKKFGTNAERLGNDLMGSQANLTRAEARKIGVNPSNVMGSISKRTGMGSLDDMAEVGKNLTGGGDDSLLDTITRAAVGESKGVEVGDLRKAAQMAIDNGGSVLSDSQRKNLLRNMTQAGVTMRGGAKGSLSTLADPGKALDQANVFRSTARDLTKGLNVSAEQRQQAKIYNDVASQIEKAIYDSPGVNESLPLLRKAGVDDMLFKAEDAANAGNKAQAEAYRQLAKELGSVQDIKSLRKMKKDFVDLAKIDEASAQAQSGAGAQLGDNMQGLGKLVQKPTNLLAVPLNAATPKVGAGIAKVSRILKGKGSAGDIDQKALKDAFTTPPAVAGTASSVFGRLVNPTVSRGAAATQPEAAPQDASLQELPEDDMGEISNMPTEDANNIFTKENIQKFILQDMAGNEGKNVTQLLALYKAFGQDNEQKVNATTQKALAQSANGESTIAQLEQLLSQAGGGQGNISGNISNFLGGLGFNNDAKTYNDLSRGSVAQLAKALGETGTLSDSDIATYSAMIPKLTDTSEVAQNKIAALKERLQAARHNTAQYGVGSSTDLTDLLGGEL